MATILRIKRRRHDDPLDSVLVSCKKQKIDEEGITRNSTVSSEEVQSFLKYAGTVSTKEAIISRPIRDAIRKHKLEKDYKKHETNLTLKSRQQRKLAAKQERFKIISSHRTIQLEDLDQTEIAYGNSNNLKDCKLKKTNDLPETSTVEISESDEKNGENCDKCGERLKLNECDGNFGNSGAISDINKEKRLCPKCFKRTESCIDSQNQEKVFQLFDVELDRPQTFPNYESLLRESQDTGSITCNSVQLVKEVVPKDGQDSEENYVYDLYYTNNRDFNLQILEKNLSIEAFTDNIYLGDEVDEEEGLYDDDDDSNDESNWRNDYPDEDPRFYENEDLDYVYTNNFDEHAAFGNYGDGELAEYMSSRCNIEDGDELSSDEEDHTYFGEQLDPMYTGHRHLGYEQYYKMVKKEMDDYEQVNADDEDDVDVDKEKNSSMD